MFINVSDYGAVGDGKTLNTKSIQQAIDACASSRGGRVYLPAGIYKCGTIWLKSHVELHLEMGAVLLASDDMKDYNDSNAFTQNFDCPSEGWVGKHLIIAHEAEDVAITGLGTVNGNCHAFVTEFRDYPQYHNGYIWSDGMSALRDSAAMRPGQLICFIECKNVTVRDITVRNSPCWSCYLLGCESVSVSGLRVSNPRWMLNSDGIDIDACRSVTVSDCIISTGDDAIAIRSSESRLVKNKFHCEDVVITNCVLSTQICALRIGVGSGLIRRVRVSNLAVTGCCNLIQLCTAYSGKGGVSIEDVSVSGVTAAGTERLLEAFCKNGAHISGITLSDISATSSMTSYIDGSGGVAENITLRNVSISLYDKYDTMTPALLAERGEHALLLKNASGVSLSNVKFSGALSADTLAHAIGCKDIELEKCNFNLK